MIGITSYLRTADGRFVQVDAVTDAPSDPHYVEGAIELVIDGVSIMDTEMWDYVDQLWAYICDMVRAYLERGEASTYFPDQPIMLSFKKQGASRVLVSIKINDETRNAAAEEKELIEALRTHGSAFFARMTVLLPQNRDGYDDALERLSQR
ncbi:MAG: hypothetical protein ACRDOO_19220 [Actinomadura sp.]